MELTQKQQEVLDFIQTYFAKQGMAPSVREIAEALGKSAQAIQQHIESLRAKGISAASTFQVADECAGAGTDRTRLSASTKCRLLAEYRPGYPFWRRRILRARCLCHETGPGTTRFSCCG